MTGVVLDAHWAGLTSAGSRLYPPDAYRAIFGLCFLAAAGALLAAAFVTETRCRNVWRASTA